MNHGVEVRADEEGARVGARLQRRIVEEEIARGVRVGGEAERGRALAQPAMRLAPGGIVGDARDARARAAEAREGFQRLGQRALCDFHGGWHRMRP